MWLITLPPRVQGGGAVKGAKGGSTKGAKRGAIKGAKGGARQLLAVLHAASRPRPPWRCGQGVQGGRERRTAVRKSLQTGAGQLAGTGHCVLVTAIGVCQQVLLGRASGPHRIGRSSRLLPGQVNRMEKSFTCTGGGGECGAWEKGRNRMRAQQQSG